MAGGSFENLPSAFLAPERLGGGGKEKIFTSQFLWSSVSFIVSFSSTCTLNISMNSFVELPLSLVFTSCSFSFPNVQFLFSVSLLNSFSDVQFLLVS